MTTLKELRDEVIDELDLQEEEWVDEPMLNRYINKAIKIAETKIHTLYENYFLVEGDPVAITAGSYKVDYPSDIYANKITKIVYDDGNNFNSHEVKRIKNIMDGVDIDINGNSTEPVLKWAPVNSASEGRKIRLFPKSGRTGYLTIWYLRNAATLVADSDVCDIDEYARYIVQCAVTRIYLKDGDPRATDSKALEEEYEKDMIDTLSDMIPDGNNEIEMDTGHYEDSN